MTREEFTDLLNPIVEGHIDSYNVNIIEGKLKGENFLGDIVFVNLEHKTTKKRMYFVVKQPVENLSKIGYFSTVYPREIYFYEHIWPLFNKFQEKYSLKFNKIPKCFNIRKTPREEKLVLENLSKQNFKIYDKTKTFDRSHIELTFKSYAVFHAISVAFKEEFSEKFDEIYATFKKLDIFDEDKEQINAFEQATLNNINYVRSLFDEDMDKAIIMKLDSFRTNGHQMYEKIGQYTETTMLNHGDCWSNNMMFQYDKSGMVTDMRLLDFQMITIGTPVRDLTYSLYTSVSKEILDNLDELLHIYIDTFSEALKQMGCQPEKHYTFDKLKSEWKQFSTYGYLLGLFMWRIKFADKNYIPKVEDNSVASSYPLAEEHKENFNNLMIELTMHFYENDLF